jgi:hypothetical protein
MNKKLPLSFEEQLRKDCPALFKLQEGWTDKRIPSPDVDPRSPNLDDFEGNAAMRIAAKRDSDPYTGRYPDTQNNKSMSAPPYDLNREENGKGSYRGRGGYSVGDTKSATINQGLGSKMAMSPKGVQALPPTDDGMINRAFMQITGGNKELTDLALNYLFSNAGLLKQIVKMAQAKKTNPGQ